mgnify:CR=1 FL=1
MMALELWLPCRGEAETFEMAASESITVGRDPKSRVFLLDERISARHVTFSSDGVGTLSVYDTSSNGSFLNGRRLKKHESARLEVGDVVSLVVPLRRPTSAELRREDIVAAFVFRPNPLLRQPVPAHDGLDDGHPVRDSTATKAEQGLWHPCIDTRDAQAPHQAHSVHTRAIAQSSAATSSATMSESVSSNVRSNVSSSVSSKVAPPRNGTAALAPAEADAFSFESEHDDASGAGSAHPAAGRKRSHVGGVGGVLGGVLGGVRPRGASGVAAVRGRHKALQRTASHADAMTSSKRCANAQLDVDEHVDERELEAQLEGAVLAEVASPAVRGDRLRSSHHHVRGAATGVRVAHSAVTLEDVHNLLRAS